MNNFTIKISLIIFFICLFPAKAMDKIEEDNKSLSSYNKVSWSVYFERLKSFHLLFSMDAQMKKYGSQEVDPSIQSLFEQSQGDLGQRVELRQMNPITKKKLERFGLFSFGSKDLRGNKTIWVNQEALGQQPEEVKDYLLTCGLEETKLPTPELKQLVLSECLVGFTTYGLFEKAKSIKKEMESKSISSLKSYDSIMSMITWEDLEIKKKLGVTFTKRFRPGFYKALGWGVAFTGPLLVIPSTPLEELIIQNHKFNAIRSAAQNDNGIRKLKFAQGALHLSSVENSFALPSDELDYITKLVKKSEQKKVLRENYYVCVNRCDDELSQCKQNNSELPPKEHELCSFNKIKCLKECQILAKQDSKSIN